MSAEWESKREKVESELEWMIRLAVQRIGGIEAKRSERGFLFGVSAEI